MAIVAALMMILVIAAPAAYATQYTVGDASGWAQQVNYITWVSGKTFRVGDTLLFTYVATLHSVDVVSQSDYNSCNSANALTSYTGGNNNVILTTTGSMYFICPTPGHCQSGMKLAVTVTAAGTFLPPPPPPPAAYATQYTVGDASGWAQQVNYIIWASGKTFRVGDTLLFTYVATLHSVDVVSQSDYSSCNTANALTSYTGGNNNVILTTTGPMYFICPTPGHCQSGMKLAITVVPSGSGAVSNFGHKSFVVLGLPLLVGGVSALMS